MKSWKFLLVLLVSIGGSEYVKGCGLVDSRRGEGSEEVEPRSVRFASSHLPRTIFSTKAVLPTVLIELLKRSTSERVCEICKINKEKATRGIFASLS